MKLDSLIKPPRTRGITIRLPADLHARLQAANQRLQACGYKPIPLQQLAVAALEEAAVQLEEMTAK